MIEDLKGEIERATINAEQAGRNQIVKLEIRIKELETLIVTMETIIEKLKADHEAALLNSSSDWEKKYNQSVEQHSKAIEALKKKHDELLSEKLKLFEQEKKQMMESMD